MNEAIKDSVGQSWVTDGCVPSVDRQLGCDDCEAATVPIPGDFQKVTAFGRGEHRQAPIAQDRQLGTLDGLRDAGLKAVASC